MFEAISGKFQEVFRKLRGEHLLSEENLQIASRMIKRALLEADVSLKIAKKFIEDVKQEALGTKVIEGVDPTQHFIKILSDKLTELMSDPDQRDPDGHIKLNLASSRPSVFLVAGLQGSGKTTTCAKLAAFMHKRFKKKPLLVAADLQRPAAVEQLKVLGKAINIDVYAEAQSSPIQVCQNALEYAKKNGNDLIILDTAGRLHIDQELMKEVSTIAQRTKPDEVLLVCDALVGQDAVRSAQAFDQELPLTGVILTKLDGDARGGAALTVKAVTGKPIKFIGVGEKVENFEEFHPDRMASRILGMGDVVSLVEKAQEVIDEKQAMLMEQKLLQEEFNMEDFLGQIESIQKMGPIKDLMKMMPGMGELPLDQFDERNLLHIKALIQSMTPRERSLPEQMNNSRKRRIAQGAGRSIDELNRLLKSFEQMKKMIKTLSNQGLFGKMANFQIKRQKRKRLKQNNKKRKHKASQQKQTSGFNPSAMASSLPGGAPSQKDFEAFKKKFKI